VKEPDPAPIHRPSEKEEPPKKDWLSDLAVPPGTSMEKGEKQIIRLHSKKDVRTFEGKFWVAGKGFAMINGGSSAYFWGSSALPQLEIEVSDVSTEALEACKEIVSSEWKGDQALFLEGEGFFREMIKPQGFLGVFKLTKILKCGLGSTKDAVKDPEQRAVP